MTRASLCVRVPRVLSEAAETQRAVAQVRVRVLHRDVVLCVSQATLRVSVVVLWLGRCGGLTRKDGSLPSLRGGPHAVAAPATWTDLLGARAERVPDCSSYLSRIPWSAADSGLSIHPRDSVDRAVWAAASANTSPALLNATAAGESTSKPVVLRLPH